jgi:hypothetical protein
MMARIVIKDLKESVDLDRAAMRQITGGWNRQRLSGIPAYESCIFQKPTTFDVFNLTGFDFDPNRQ